MLDKTCKQHKKGRAPHRSSPINKQLVFFNPLFSTVPCNQADQKGHDFPPLTSAHRSRSSHPTVPQAAYRVVLPTLTVSNKWSGPSTQVSCVVFKEIPRPSALSAFKYFIIKWPVILLYSYTGWGNVTSFF